MFSESGGKLNAGGLVSLSKSLQLILFSCLKVKVGDLYQWSTIMDRQGMVLFDTGFDWLVSQPFAFALHIQYTIKVGLQFIALDPICYCWTQ